MKKAIGEQTHMARRQQLSGFLEAVAQGRGRLFRRCGAVVLGALLTAASVAAGGAYGERIDEVSRGGATPGGFAVSRDEGTPSLRDGAERSPGEARRAAGDEPPPRPEGSYDLGAHHTMA